MLLLCKTCLLFKTGGPHNTVVTQMARPWTGIGSVLLNTHSVEHHDGVAISSTARLVGGAGRGVETWSRHLESSLTIIFQHCASANARHVQHLMFLYSNDLIFAKCLTILTYVLNHHQLKWKELLQTMPVMLHWHQRILRSHQGMTMPLEMTLSYLILG